MLLSLSHRALRGYALFVLVGGVLLLAGLGHPTASMLFALTLVVPLWDLARDPYLWSLLGIGARELEESISLNHPAQAVWAVIRPPDAFSATVAQSFRVPGTPEGVGEVQVSITTDGELSAIEVIDEVPPLQSVTRNLSTLGRVPSLAYHLIQPTAQGCTLTERVVLTSRVMRFNRKAERIWRDGMRQYLAAVEAALAPVPTGPTQ